MGRPPLPRGLLAVTSPEPVLSLLAALGLAQAAESALVVDLCRDLALSGRSLSDIAAEGPSLADLRPGRAGVALLGSGPIGAHEARPSRVARVLGRIHPVRALRDARTPSHFRSKRVIKEPS